MSSLHQAGVAASAFIFSAEKHGNFYGSLSRRLPNFPVQALKVGSLLNWMVSKGISDRGSVLSIGGDYPNAFIMGGGKNYNDIVPDVQNGLQQLAIPANLSAAMSCVVGIQDSFLALGVDSVINGAHSTLQATSGAYKMASTAYDYGGKAKSARDSMIQLRDWMREQHGDPVDVFFRAM